MGYEAGVAYLFWMSAAVAVFLFAGFVYACLPVKGQDRIGTAAEAPQRKRRRIRHDAPAIKR